MHRAVPGTNIDYLWIINITTVVVAANVKTMLMFKFHLIFTATL